MSKSLTSFRPGRSGNPGGRKRLDPDVKAILEAACPDAAQLLVDMMNDEEIAPGLRVQCAETVLNRIYGKPAQAMTINSDAPVNMADLTNEELLQIILDGRAELEAMRADLEAEERARPAPTHPGRANRNEARDVGPGRPISPPPLMDSGTRDERQRAT